MKFRKKPVMIEAFQWTGGMEQIEDPTWACQAIRDGLMRFRNDGTPHVSLLIDTPEGIMTARIGDWIIKGVKGELCPCRPDIFEASYEPVEPGSKGYAER